LQVKNRLAVATCGQLLGSTWVKGVLALGAICAAGLLLKKGGDVGA